MKRMLSETFLLLLLTGLLTLASNVNPVAANGETIYIRADGSIDANARLISSIFRSSDNYYVLTCDIWCDGIEIERDNMTLDGAGFTLARTSGYGFGFGVYLSGRKNVTVRNAQIKYYYDARVGGGAGVWLVSSSNCSISGNEIRNNYVGIYFGYSNNNSISGNNITYTNAGVWLNSSPNNSISGNNIANNWKAGIWLDSSSYNTVYHNNFINNMAQVNIENSLSLWDNGCEGNYWSDYLLRYPSASEIDSSGIGDTSYAIDQYNTDRYPLINAQSVPEFPSLLALPLLMAAILLTVMINRKNTVRRMVN